MLAVRSMQLASAIGLLMVQSCCAQLFNVTLLPKPDDGSGAATSPSTLVCVTSAHHHSLMGHEYYVMCPVPMYSYLFAYIALSCNLRHTHLQLVGGILRNLQKSFVVLP